MLNRTLFLEVWLLVITSSIGSDIESFRRDVYSYLRVEPALKMSQQTLSSVRKNLGSKPTPMLTIFVVGGNEFEFSGLARGLRPERRWSSQAG